MDISRVVDITEQESKAELTTSTTTTQPLTTLPQPSTQPSQPSTQPLPKKQLDILSRPLSDTAVSFEDASKLICEYYNTLYQQLECLMPLQIVDGSVVDFIDREKDVLLANARVRFTNVSTVNNGALYVEVKFANLAFVRQKHTLKMQMVENV